MGEPVTLTERIEVRLTKEQRAKLERIAAAEERTASQIVRRWIVKAEEPRK